MQRPALATPVSLTGRGRRGFSLQRRSRDIVVTIAQLSRLVECGQQRLSAFGGIFPKGLRKETAPVRRRWFQVSNSACPTLLQIAPLQVSLAGRLCKILT